MRKSRTDSVRVRKRTANSAQWCSTKSRTCNASQILLSHSRSLARDEHGNRYASFQFPGGHTARVTPVPIPNTEVKPRRADDTARASSPSGSRPLFRRKLVHRLDDRRSSGLPDEPGASRSGWQRGVLVVGVNDQGVAVQVDIGRPVLREGPCAGGAT